MPKTGFYSITNTVSYQEFAYHILIEIQVRCVFKEFSPFEMKQHPIVLCSGTPHGRPLTPVQHSELYGRQICYNTRIPPHCVYFSYYLPFCNPSHGGVAAHLGNSLHVHGNQKGLGPQICSSSGRLTAGMASPNDYNIIFFKHGAKITPLLSTNYLNCVPRGTLIGGNTKFFKIYIFFSSHFFDFRLVFVPVPTKVERSMKNYPVNFTF